MANELVPQMEAAQSAYERETAALNAALQAIFFSNFFNSGREVRYEAPAADDE